MKKLLPSVSLALASLAALAGYAPASDAFGLFTGCHCCKACGGTITLRQYNAFSPVACGSMMFQGCVMSPPPAQPQPGGFSGFSGFGGECTDGSCGGETVSRAPVSYPAQTPTYSYPAVNYDYAQAMQMQQYQAWQQMLAMQQMRQMQQLQYMQQMQQLPVQTMQPTGARMP
jgi:hypothetical protein